MIRELTRSGAEAGAAAWLVRSRIALSWSVLPGLELTEAGVKLGPAGKGIVLAGEPDDQGLHVEQEEGIESPRPDQKAGLGPLRGERDREGLPG